MQAPIASPFGDQPKPPATVAAPNLHWDAAQRCFALQYRSPIRAKIRCLPKELRRAPFQVALLFLMSPLWFVWTTPLNLPLPLHILLAIVLSPLGIFALMLLQWNANKAPGLVMIRRDGLVDQFPSKTALWGWAQLQRAFQDDGDLFFLVSATKGCYFPREAFKDAAEGALFFEIVESLMRNDGANWEEVSEKHAPALIRAARG